MSQYGVVFDGLWDGTTGRAIARIGGRDAQVLVLYLLKNPDDNMIGLYRADLTVMRQRIQTLSMKALKAAWGALSVAEFAEYDLTTEHVWVREMARYRLGLDRGALDPRDKRAVGAQGLYERAKPSPFLEPFFRRYRKELHLPKVRRFEGAPRILGRDFEGASKPVTGISNRDQDQRSGNHQDQDQQISGARPERAPVPTRELLTTFDNLHRKLLGTPAVILPGKDAAHIARLYRTHGDLVGVLMEEFFASRDPFIRDAGYTIGVFLSQAGKLIARRRSTVRASPPPDWRSECRSVHGGRCTNAHFHAAKMREAASA